MTDIVAELRRVFENVQTPVDGILAVTSRDGGWLLVPQFVEGTITGGLLCPLEQALDLARRIAEQYAITVATEAEE